MNEPERHYAERKSQSQEDRLVSLHLHEVPGVVKFTGTDSRVVGVGPGRGGWGFRV